jgi:tetratricopeptide (TPR) repeat protein
MADVSDMDLVREYADRNSEPTFAELVHRHINLVYSVALRFTGHSQDAQDVTQAVFIILAQKAGGLRAKTILTGWLYETTRFQLNPQCGGFYCNRGQSKFALNDMTEALADYNKAIELDPKTAIAYFNRGQLKYCANKDFTGAIVDYTKAIELHTDPQEDDIYFARGNAKMELQDFVGAVTDFTKTVELNPTNEQAYTNLGLAQKALQDSNKRP